MKKYAKDLKKKLLKIVFFFYFVRNRYFLFFINFLTKKVCFARFSCGTPRKLRAMKSSSTVTRSYKWTLPVDFFFGKFWITVFIDRKFRFVGDTQIGLQIFES